MAFSVGPFGAFTLPGTETDTEYEANTGTNKLAQNPMLICAGVSVQYEHPHTILNNPFFMSLFISLGVGQCEHTINGTFT